MDSSKQGEGSGPEPSFPDDYGQRLERLLELADLSWEQFADLLGAEYNRVMEWRGGATPTGGEVWHITSLAYSIPGGIEVMLPESAAGGDQTARAVRSSAVRAWSHRGALYRSTFNCRRTTAAMGFHNESSRSSGFNLMVQI